MNVPCEHCLGGRVLSDNTCINCGYSLVKPRPSRMSVKAAEEIEQSLLRDRREHAKRCV
jgi:hypothetical protein